MTDTEREKKALRTISVTRRAAHRHVSTDAERRLVDNRAQQLLDELERAVREDGNDPDVRHAIDEERQAGAP
jgi:hypothetical protein